MTTLNLIQMPKKP